MFKMKYEKDIDRLTMWSFFTEPTNMINISHALFTLATVICSVSRRNRVSYSYTIVMVSLARDSSQLMLSLLSRSRHVDVLMSCQATAGLLAWQRLIMFLKGLSTKFALYVLTE